MAFAIYDEDERRLSAEEWRIRIEKETAFSFIEQRDHEGLARWALNLVCDAGDEERGYPRLLDIARL